MFFLTAIYLAAPRTTLGHYRGDSLIRPMLINAFSIFELKVTRTLIVRLGPYLCNCKLIKNQSRKKNEKINIKLVSSICYSINSEQNETIVDHNIFNTNILKNRAFDYSQHIMLIMYTDARFHLIGRTALGPNLSKTI